MVLPAVGSFITGILGFSGPRQPKKEPDLLEQQEVRARIMRYLRTHECASITELCEQLGLSWGVAQHHLFTLLKGGLVYSAPHGRTNLFYPKEGQTNRTLILALLRTGRARDIATAVAASPGVRQKELLERLNISRKVFRHHIELLVSAGLVSESRGGASRNYTPTDLMRRELANVQPPAPRPPSAKRAK